MQIDWQKWWPRWNAGHIGSLSDEPTESAPYMVTVSASHVSGNVALFDSEHRHNGFVALRIFSAERQRGNGRDWIRGDKELIEVCMSHAQWAAMISTPNSGSGVSGTLQHIFNQTVEQPQVDKRTEKYGPELVKALERAVDKIDAMKGGKLTKGQQHELDMIRQEICANMPFVARQFSEHMEERTQKARSDIEAHMQSAVHRVGLAAMSQSERLVALLNKPTD